MTKLLIRKGNRERVQSVAAPAQADPGEGLASTALGDVYLRLAPMPAQNDAAPAAQRSLREL
ncbi:MAG: hypothetical protein WCE38_20845, partial [Burkholderiales bacterium]